MWGGGLATEASNLPDKQKKQHAAAGCRTLVLRVLRVTENVFLTLLKRLRGSSGSGSANTALTGGETGGEWGEGARSGGLIVQP